MVTIAGYLGYRALGDFMNLHKETLIETLKVQKKKPCHLIQQFADFLWVMNYRKDRYTLIV